MAYSYLTQLFTGGLNKDIDAAAIDLTMGQDMTINVVADVQNMLFERGLVLTRPGLQTVSTPISLITSGQTLIRAQGLTIAAYAASPEVTRGAYVLTRDAVPATHLWSLNCLFGTGQIFDATEITGPGGYQVPLTPGFSVAQVNGVLLFGNGNQSNGMLRWDPNTNVYTILNPASNFLFVTGHYARAVGAFGGPSPVLFHQTIGFSAQGDETNWTSLDAGTSTLADIPDSITGIGVINGVIILARTYGFHFGWATGTFPNVYNWRMYSQNSVGCFYPETFQIYKNVAYFMSDAGIHTFDMNEIVDIGEGIYEEMMGHIQNDFTGNMSPIAFIAPSYNTDWRPAYHVVLMRSAVTNPRMENPHYIYDLREQKWSRHTYVPTNLATMFRFAVIEQSQSTTFPYIVQALQAAGPLTPSFVAWLQGTPQDQPALVTTGQINLSGDPVHDNQLDRVLVVYFATGASFTVTITVNYSLNGAAFTTNFTFATHTTTGQWDKRWVDIRVVGDFHQVSVSTPTSAPTPFKIKKLVMEFSQVGKVRT